MKKLAFKKRDHEKLKVSAAFITASKPNNFHSILILTKHRSFLNPFISYPYLQFLSFWFLSQAFHFVGILSFMDFFSVAFSTSFKYQTFFIQAYFLGLSFDFSFFLCVFHFFNFWVIIGMLFFTFPHYFLWQH